MLNNLQVVILRSFLQIVNFLLGATGISTEAHNLFPHVQFLTETFLAQGQRSVQEIKKTPCKLVHKVALCCERFDTSSVPEF